MDQPGHTSVWRSAARWAALLSIALATAAPLAARPSKARAPAAVVPAPSPLETAARAQSDPDLLTFYAARKFQPLWLTADGGVTEAAGALIRFVETASYDGLDSATLDAAGLAAAVARLGAEATPAARAHAEVALARGFAAYVKAMRMAPAAEMAYESEALRPLVQRTYWALDEAARAPSLAQYVGEMRWMHPLYGELRRALADGPPADPGVQRSALDTLQRLRAIPPVPGAKYVLVDAASARLWMYQDGRVVDSMRVVVGKPDQQTPLLSGYIRHAILNPYWNIPHDLVPKNIAPNVLKLGLPYLKSRGYEVLSDWTPTAQVLDPKTVDWRKVADRELELRVRQLPNGFNAMGRVKFEFPNPRGIYLHDTPEKGLLQKDKRQLSSGCIRLEDAARLGLWLFGTPLPDFAGQPEQKLDLPALVPVYVTYLTAYAAAGAIAVGPDPYKRVGGPPPAALAQTAASPAEPEAWSLPVPAGTASR
ncbi:MAG: L,D-transpeptidase family protein [Novosphingobium sp.]